MPFKPLHEWEVVKSLSLEILKVQEEYLFRADLPAILPRGKPQPLALGLPAPLPARTSTEGSGLLFVLHLVDHRPAVIAQGPRLPSQNLLGVVQVNLRVSRSWQLGERVLKGAGSKRRGQRGERKQGRVEREKSDYNNI